MFEKTKKLIIDCSKGMRGLMQSRKGTFCLLSLVMLSVLGAMGKLDGVAFTAGCTMISGIFCWAHTKTDNNPNNEPSQSFIDKIRDTINK